MGNKHQPFRRFTLLFSLTFGIACSAGATELTEARETCARKANNIQRLNLSSGIYTERAIASAPLYIDLPIGYDTGQYSDCMVREGFAGDEKIRAEFERLDACWKNDTRPIRLTRHRRSTVSISSEIDNVAYRRCVNREITVEAEISNPPR